MFIGDISIVNGIITRMDSMFFFRLESWEHHGFFAVSPGLFGMPRVAK